MRIVVDRGRCTALGNCESVAPEIFEVDDEGELVVLRPEIDAEIGSTERLDAERAVAGCPNAALSLAED